MDLVNQLRLADRRLFSCCYEHGNLVESLAALQRQQEELESKKSDGEKRIGIHLATLMAEIQTDDELLMTATPMRSLVEEIEDCRARVAETDAKLRDLQDNRDMLKHLMIRSENAIKEATAEVIRLHEML